MVSRIIVIASLLLSTLICVNVWSRPNINCVQELFGRWMIAARSEPGHGLVFRHLIRQLPERHQNRLVMVATPFPDSTVRAGTDIQRIRQMNWRSQPESLITVRFNPDETAYQVQENHYLARQIGARGMPDLAVLSSCLFRSSVPHLPSVMHHVNSLPAMLDGLLDTEFQREEWASAPSGQRFAPGIILGNNLFARSTFSLLNDSSEGSVPSGNCIYTRADSLFPHRKRTEWEQTPNPTVIHLGAAPHTASCSLYHWNHHYMASTLNAAGELIFLISLPLAVQLNWLAGDCKPYKECVNPQFWDRDGTGRQTNGFPIPTAIW